MPFVADAALLCAIDSRCAVLHQRKLSEVVVTAFAVTPDDSFVRRLRSKTEVYAEWILWPLTVQAMQWALERRKSQTHIVGGDGKGTEIPFSSSALVLLNDHGHAFSKPTKSGNPNNQITNAWTRLLKTDQSRGQGISLASS